jgi:hypothetical protein
MAARKPMMGPGAFQWNGGAWLGGQIGGTAWMLPTSVLYLSHGAIGIALVCLVCCALCNAIGTWLWSRRDQIAPFPAMMVLLLVCVAGSSIVLMTIQILRSDHDPAMPSAAWLVVLCLVLALQHSLIEWGRRRERSHLPEAKKAETAAVTGSLWDRELE